jgi:hypothetical protein
MNCLKPNTTLRGIFHPRHTVHGETGDYCRQLRIQECLFHGLLQTNRTSLSLCPHRVRDSPSSEPVLSVEEQWKSRFPFLDTIQSGMARLYDWEVSVTLIK